MSLSERPVIPVYKQLEMIETLKSQIQSMQTQIVELNECKSSMETRIKMLEATNSFHEKAINEMRSTKIWNNGDEDTAASDVDGPEIKVTNTKQLSFENGFKQMMNANNDVIVKKVMTSMGQIMSNGTFPGATQADILMQNDSKEHINLQDGIKRGTIQQTDSISWPKHMDGTPHTPGICMMSENVIRNGGEDITREDENDGTKDIENDTDDEKENFHVVFIQGEKSKKLRTAKELNQYIATSPLQDKKRKYTIVDRDLSYIEMHKLEKIQQKKNPTFQDGTFKRPKGRPASDAVAFCPDTGYYYKHSFFSE